MCLQTCNIYQAMMFAMVVTCQHVATDSYITDTLQKYKLTLVSHMQVIEGSSIQFNCSHLQNNTNSMPPKTASFCPGLSAVYYSQWTVSVPFYNKQLVMVCVCAAVLCCHAAFILLLSEFEPTLPIKLCLALAELQLCNCYWWCCHICHL